MALEYDTDGNIQKITGLIHSGKNYTITFISGSFRAINNVGYVTQQLVHLPVPSSSLSEAKQLAIKIASALGNKTVSGIDNKSFNVNFFDTAINHYDIIKFINYGTEYTDDSGNNQLSLYDTIPNHWDSESRPANAETIAIIEWKKIRPWWCWLVPWWC